MNTLHRVSGPARDGGEMTRDRGEIARDGGEIARDEAGAKSARGAGGEAGGEAARDSDEVELPIACAYRARVPIACAYRARVPIACACRVTGGTGDRNPSSNPNPNPNEVELPEMLRDLGRAMQVRVGSCWE